MCTIFRYKEFISKNSTLLIALYNEAFDHALSIGFIMNIRYFFGSSSKAAVNNSNISSSKAESEEENGGFPCKTHSTSSPTLPKKLTSSMPYSSTRKYHKTWEDYPWLQYDADAEGAFCKICKVSGKSVQ